MASSLTSDRIVEKPDARRKSLFYPFLLPVTDQKVDVIGFTEVLLFELPLTLEELRIRMFDPGHGL
jgi:hypothetical protein